MRSDAVLLLLFAGLAILLAVKFLGAVAMMASFTRRRRQGEHWRTRTGRVNLRRVQHGDGVHVGPYSNAQDKMMCMIIFLRIDVHDHEKQQANTFLMHPKSNICVVTCMCATKCVPYFVETCLSRSKLKEIVLSIYNG